MVKLPTPDSLPKPRPPRTPNRFRQTELARAVRATILAGLAVARVEVDPASGKFSVITGAPESEDTTGAKAWDAEIAKLKATPKGKGRGR